MNDFPRHGLVPISGLVGALLIPALLPQAAHGMYDPKHGRWLQRDPAGVTVTPSSPKLDRSKQYHDGADLYEYVRSSPCKVTDPEGRYGRDLHHEETSRWAQNRRSRYVGVPPRPANLRVMFGGFRPAFAEAMGRADNAVDGWFNAEGWIVGLDWHFDVDTEGGRVASTWDAGDSRYRHAEEQMRIASRLCAHQQGRERQAVEELGKGLHAMQDFYAHGNWRVWFFPSPIPLVHPFWPTWYDMVEFDGHGAGGVPVQALDGHFVTPRRGFQRYERMRRHSFEYMNRFIGEVVAANGPNTQRCLCNVLNGWPCQLPGPHPHP